MAMVTNSEITMLNNLKPYKTAWKVEVKVLRSWSQQSNYSGEDTFEFLLEDRMVPSIDHNKESSPEDLPTSGSKRKEGDADLNDMNSTSKKLCG
ncbi:unnamed protein product [Brassica oleracea var. botrytis]